MDNNLFQQHNSNQKLKKNTINLNKKISILFLGLGTLVLPTLNVPFVAERFQPFLTGKVVAQLQPDTTEEKVVKIAILSKEAEELTTFRWQPTIDYLTKTIPGYKFELITGGFEEILELAATNSANFYITDSGMYVNFEANYGATRIATLKNLRLGKSYIKFGGVIITKANRSDIDELKDLKNKNFMAVSPNSLGGWQMAEGVLHDAGIDNAEKFFKTIEYGKTHESVIKAVASGEADAGTIRTDALERAVARGEAKLEDFKIINEQKTEGFPFAHSTPLYPEWPFAAAQGTDIELEELVAQALLSMPSRSKAARAAKSEGWTVAQNYRPVHELFINLAIAPYDEIGQVTITGFFKKYPLVGVGIGGAILALAGYIFYAQRQALAQQKADQDALNDLNQSLEESASDQKKQREELEEAIVGLMEALEPAADGDLTVRAQLVEGDVGIIADLFNAIVENLRDIALQVQNSAGQVNSSIQENEGSIRQIAEQSVQEANQIRNTLSSVELMANSIREVAANAEKTAHISNDAFTSAQEGNTVMEKTVDSIQGLRSTIGDTAKKIKRLGESAQQISQVVALIDEIALKTNLLAINASVEAARAGELGQGFTAVAEQVGALAEQSGSATKEIAQLITSIQQETQEVVAAMETGTSQVVDSTRLVEETKINLGNVLTKSQEIDQLMKSISQATISQAETSQAVTEIMMLNSKTSQERSQSSGQVAQAMEATTTILKQLQDSVGQFKVNDTDISENSVSLT